MSKFDYTSDFLKKVHQIAIDKVRTQSYGHNKQYLDGNQLVAKAWVDSFIQTLAAQGFEIVSKKVETTTKNNQ